MLIKIIRVVQTCIDVSIQLIITLQILRELVHVKYEQSGQYMRNHVSPKVYLKRMTRKISSCIFIQMFMQPVDHSSMSQNSLAKLGAI